MSNDNLLNIENLAVKVDDKEILKGINLGIGKGEVHAIMGLNGSGKSTLANVLAGREDYDVVKGEVFFKGNNLLSMSPEERAQQGLFMAFQYPVEIPGVLMSYFIRTAYNAKMEAQGKKPLTPREFNALLTSKAEELNLNKALLKRDVNEGFSGGEKKKCEILQMLVLEPDFCILDETDSGLDIDALKSVAKGVSLLRSSNTDRSFLIITHYQRILEHIKPDIVHIMLNGKIVKSGGLDLVAQIEKYGYNWLIEEERKVVEA